MALTVAQKRTYFQNTSKLLHENTWEKCVRSYESNLNSVSNFYINDKIYFQTKDWLNASELLYKNIELKPLILLQDSNKENCKDYNRFHLIRNKKNCTVVIGNEIFANLQEENIEKRLNNTLASLCAEKLDTDLYSCHIENIDNTSNSLLLESTLKYLEQFNYDQIYLIFQISDPVRCFNSLWWDPITLMMQNPNPILKEHMSYHFWNHDQMLEAYRQDNDINFLKDSLVFSLGKNKKNGYLTITPNEFYQIYEWSIIDIVEKQIDKFESMNIKKIFWRDFFNVCNKDLNLIDTAFINFIDQQINVLPYDSNNGNFVKDLVADEPEKMIKKLKKINFIPDLPKYFYNVICEPSQITKLLFSDCSPTIYGEFFQRWMLEANRYSNVEKWANHILYKAGWLK